MQIRGEGVQGLTLETNKQKKPDGQAYCPDPEIYWAGNKNERKGLMNMFVDLTQKHKTEGGNLTP